MNPGITVVIATARANEDTSYWRWESLRNAFLSYRLEWEDPSTKAVLQFGPPGRRPAVLTGELGAILTACFSKPAEYHVDYQLRALAVQTRRPDEVLVVSRTKPPGHDFVDGMPVTYVEPMLSRLELDLNPLSSMYVHPQMESHVGRRKRNVSLGCSDKNTGLVLCRTENLIFLDDCCLPGPGFVEQAEEVCMEGQILLPAHRQLYLPTEDQPTVRYSDANTNLQTGHLVMGIWAGPLQYFLDINGWNTDLDGQRGGLDLELKVRMDRYLQMREREYAIRPHARVYEIEHTYPWVKGERDWKEKVPNGYVAPDPSLKQIREQLFKDPDFELSSEEDLLDDAVNDLHDAVEAKVLEIIRDVDEEEET